MGMAAIPAWLAWTMVGTSAATAGYSAYAQNQSSKTQQEIAEVNAQQAEYAASDAIRRGGIEEQQIRRQGRQAVGAGKAAVAKSGLALDVGSPLGALAASAGAAEADVMAARANAAREAWGFKTQALDLRTQGQLARAKGRWGAGATLLGGALDAASFGMNLKSSGVVNGWGK